MRKIAIVISLLFLCGSAQAKPVKAAKPASGMKAAVTRLNALTDSDIDWAIAKAKTAEVTCGSDADRVLFGTSADSVWIGIVPAKGRPQMMDFPMTRHTHNGFCAKPKKISLSALSCKGGKGRLEDCTPAPSCKQFAVDDGSCDPFNFYWDSRHETVRWWR